MGYGVLAGASGGTGGGSDQHLLASEWDGPTSYPTGGFVIDLSDTFSSLNVLRLQVKTVGANLPVAHYEVALNTPGAGQATVKIMRHQYDRVSSAGNVQNQPGGVTVQAASGVASSSESAHTHSIDHDHAPVTSSTPSPAGAALQLNAIGPNLSQHTHQVDLPNLAGTSGAGSAHNHQDNSIYQHQHVATQAATQLTSSQLPNATDLSGTTWYLMATGVKA